MDEHTSTLVRKAPCPECGSRDNLGVFSDGHGHCFGCGAYIHAVDSPTKAKVQTRPVEGLAQGEAQDLPRRKLRQDTCGKWGYLIGYVDGKPAQLATYRDLSGRSVAQKVRFADKTFKWVGEPKKAGLYGQHLWRDGGKMLVITEGEIDALSVSQAQENKWPVVSLPNGAQAAAKDIAKQLEWVMKFEKVILMFDGDEHGQKASEEVAAMLPPGKAHIAKLALKDASDMLQAGRDKEIIDAIWQAKLWRPDEIVAGTDLWDVIIDDSKEARCLQYPWEGLNGITRGLRMGEITLIGAGTGVGKSSICRELAHYLLSLRETVGVIALEESVRRTAYGILSVELSKPLHLNREGVTTEQLREAYDKTVGNGRFFTYDHFGSMESENLFNRIRYMVTGCGCQWIVLDHLSIVVSGMEDGDERRLIDNVMTKLRSMVEELGFGLILISHLKETDGKKSLEEGGETHLNLLRGSRSIGQLSDTVLGLERNQQDPATNHLTRLRVLKNRFSGETGVACVLSYDKETGRLSEHTEKINWEEESEGEHAKGF
jgi:twinkle protein